MRRRNQGVTLTELLLVVLIGTTIIYFGIQQYRMLRVNSDIQTIQYNLATIFQAAANYYQANCRTQYVPMTTTVAHVGTLDPANSPANPYPITITQLKASGYLDKPLLQSAIVDNTNQDLAYVVQFNEVASDRTISGLSSGTTLSTIKLGKIILWRVQVSVLLNANHAAAVYKNLLVADCISSYVAGSQTVTACPGGGSGNNYLVFERLPSYEPAGEKSDMWVNNQNTVLFNQMYMTYPITYLMNVPSTAYPQQNYLCGG